MFERLFEPCIQAMQNACTVFEAATRSTYKMGVFRISAGGRRQISESGLVDLRIGLHRLARRLLSDTLGKLKLRSIRIPGQHRELDWNPLQSCSTQRAKRSCAESLATYSVFDRFRLCTSESVRYEVTKVPDGRR